MQKEFGRSELPLLTRIINAIGTNQVDQVSRWIHENKEGIVRRWRNEHQMK
jgi:hypothetical protein